MRLGLEKARGNMVVFFPEDDEYRAEDIYGIVSLMVNSRFRVVFGTRAVKCTDLSERLKRIYNNNWRLYLTSKYGGILLSVTTLFLYNRYVSDVLSSVKGYDAHLLRALALESNGLDLETEIVAKLARRREYMVEMPVEYKPQAAVRGKEDPLRRWPARPGRPDPLSPLNRAATVRERYACKRPPSPKGQATRAVPAVPPRTTLEDANSDERK